MFDSLFVFAQRECPFRVIERVVDSRGRLSRCGGGGCGLLGFFLTLEQTEPDEYLGRPRM